MDDNPVNIIYSWGIFIAIRAKTVILRRIIKYICYAVTFVFDNGTHKKTWTYFPLIPDQATESSSIMVFQIAKQLNKVSHLKLICNSESMSWNSNSNILNINQDAHTESMKYMEWWKGLKEDSSHNYKSSSAIRYDIEGKY